MKFTHCGHIGTVDKNGIIQFCGHEYSMETLRGELRRSASRAHYYAEYRAGIEDFLGLASWGRTSLEENLSSHTAEHGCGERAKILKAILAGTADDLVIEWDKALV